MLQAQLRRGLDALCVSTSEAVDTDPARDPSQHSDDGHRAGEGQMRATSQDATSAESGSRKTSPRVHDATPVASHPHGTPRKISPRPVAEGNGSGHSRGKEVDVQGGHGVGCGHAVAGDGGDIVRDALGRTCLHLAAQLNDLPALQKASVCV